MTRALPVALLAALSACGGGGYDHGSTTHEQGRTELIYVPTLHRAHAREDGYSFAYLRRLLTTIAPDVVLAEIAPGVFERVLPISDARRPGTPAQDPWLERRPEVSEVVLPLRLRLGYEVVPVSGLTSAATRDFAAYFQAHPSGPDAGYSRRALRAVRVMADEDSPAEEPVHALSPSYRVLAGWPRQALSTAAEDALGEGGPRRLAHAHFELMRRAIEAHAGARIAVVFDAADAWYLVPRLRRLPGVHYIDAMAFRDALRGE